MNEFYGGYQGVGGQLAPQGFLGGLIGAPLGGLIGKGIGSLFGRPDLGSQIGNAAGGIGGAFLPFAADPVSAAYQQQAVQQQLQQQLQQQQLGQLAPQGWFGNLISAVGQPLGGAIGGLFGNSQLGSTIGGAAGQLGRMLPFSADPVSQAYQQQMGQLAPQGWFGNLIGAVGQPLGTTIGTTLGNAQLGTTIGGLASQLGRMLPFSADPVSQAYQQQAGQLAPQGWFGNLIGTVGQPLGGAIGGLFGNSQLGSTIGDVAGQLGRMLPFSADPLAMQQFVQTPPHVLLQHIRQLQQQLQQQQQQYAQLAQQTQQQQQVGQQGQIAPQGWFGNLISAVGQPLGGAIGGLFGNSQLGSTIGGAAGQLGRMLPFGADPVTQAYLQQAQLAQQQAQMGQGNGYFPTQGMQYTQQPTLH